MDRYELIKDEIYQCNIEHYKTKKQIPIKLKYVNEDDCDWRTADDNSELDYSWNVIDYVMLNKEEAKNE